MSKEYQFTIPAEERDAVARGIARMKGFDPEKIIDKRDGNWEGCLMWAAAVILAKQYADQVTEA